MRTVWEVSRYLERPHDKLSVHFNRDLSGSWNLGNRERWPARRCLQRSGTENPWWWTSAGVMSVAVSHCFLVLQERSFHSKYTTAIITRDIVHCISVLPTGRDRSKDTVTLVTVELNNNGIRRHVRLVIKMFNHSLHESSRFHRPTLPGLR